MANRWGKNGNSNEFIFLGSKITLDGDCSPEIKGLLLLRRKAMENLENVLKSREITSPTKVYIVKEWVSESCSVMSHSLNPMDYSQAPLSMEFSRQEAVPFSRGSSQPRYWTQVKRIAGRFFIKSVLYTNCLAWIRDYRVFIDKW